ncbi:unnamed protein product [Meganyctiphanes norvegica]|uniref:Uncharacterized protein n=1 Tax=Meganyctiphanes norvegica TaxID=48144 RepID=A0AAV2RAM5_MEGNR
MDEIDYDTSHVYQEIKDVLVDTDEKVKTMFHKLINLSFSDFSQLVIEHLKLIFSNRQCDELITIRNVLMNPEKCSDPYIRLGLMCFTLIITNRDKFMRQIVFITISQMAVDNFITYVEGHLFDSHILINLINIMHETDTFSCSVARFELTLGAKQMNKNHNDLLDEFYANIIDLLAKLNLIEIKCITFKNMSDVMLVYNDMVTFFDIYHEISNYIVVHYPKTTPFIEKSVMSAIAVITNCIFLFQAKLLASDIDSSHWSNMICMMEKLRNHMAILSLPPSSGTSLQRFLIERSHGNVNTNCTKKLYNVTNYINQVDIRERSSDTTVRISLRRMEIVLYDLKHYFDETEGETDDLYSDDENSTNGNGDSGTDENSEHSV